MRLACGPRTFRTLTRSEPLRTNERAIMSMLLGTPHPRISSLSFSVSVGRSTTTPGRFTFFLSPNMAVFSQRHLTVPAAGSHDRTVSVMVPSAHKMSVVTVISWPSLSCIGFPSFKKPVRISGPCIRFPHLINPEQITNGRQGKSKEKQKSETLVSSMTAQRIWVLCIAILRLFKPSLETSFKIPSMSMFDISPTESVESKSSQPALTLSPRKTSTQPFYEKKI
nr:hypothetical protein C4D60_Mb02t05790 [Ipomoea batatas]